MVFDNQTICDIVMLYDKGLKLEDIAQRYGTSRNKVKDILKHYGVELKCGVRKSVDGTSKREQIIALWQNGITDVTIIKQKLNTSYHYICNILNAENISIKKMLPLKQDIIFMYDMQKKKDIPIPRGWQASIARKYGVSRQAVTDTINRLKRQNLI